MDGNGYDIDNEDNDMVVRMVVLMMVIKMVFLELMRILNEIMLTVTIMT